MNVNMDLEQLILELFAVEGIKFGNYTLKSGIEAPVYVDLRVVISYPKLMVEVSNFLWESAKKAKGSFKTICGVPYTALPLATCISVKENIPMLIRRKEAKGYGTKKLIEGIFNEGDGCLIIEDVCTSGSSVLDTVQALNSVGIAVTDAVVLLDREQGAEDMLKYENITLHSICKLSHVIEILEKHGKIDSDMVSKVKTFITENRFKPPSSIDQLPKKYDHIVHGL
ncbi:uridine 5'-monophosphate synthase isoform X3 [Patella vulgata]|uniref:uridine 5'-monophosphate synthase isoform X3 n=1 Tax=Patella vulgata TaxID=6465 RepID=UPI0021806CD4|nr:uridine 5'-monophosphate synthase isoform X3 [Patella vulgata]